MIIKAVHSTIEKIETGFGSVSGLSHMTRDIKLSCFDGKEENWRVKFLARAQILGYKEYLEDRSSIKEDSKALDVTNTYAYGDLIIYCDGLAFCIVEMSKTEKSLFP